MINEARNQAQKQPQPAAFLLAMIAPFAIALIGGSATSTSVTNWYRTLKKPSWNPPAWIFGPVWTVLYTMMGVASWLVWRQGRQDIDEDGNSLRTSVQARDALKVYGIHLVFNALWSIVFFGMRRIGWALAEIAVLWSLIATTTARFYRIRPAAGLLLLPYLLWATFASVLNFVLWRKNRSSPQDARKVA